MGYGFANYGRAPDALPSLAAIRSQSRFLGLPAFSSFVGSPSSLQQGSDFCLSQVYHQQSQFEELAFWQSLQKQQNNIALPGSLHSEPPQQHFRFIEPLKPSHKQHVEPPWTKHCQFEQQHLNSAECPLKIGNLHSQEVLYAISPTPHESQSQRLVLPSLRINEGKSVSQKPPLFSGTQYFPGRPSYMGKEKGYGSAAYGQARDALPSLPAIKSQSLVLGLPAFSSCVGSPSSLRQGSDCSLSQIYHQQSQVEELAFWQKPQNNLVLPGSLQSEPPQQHFRFIEPLKPSHKLHMEPPWSNHCQFEQQHLNFSERPLKIGDQHSQEVPHAISPTPHESQLQRLVLPDLRINEGKSFSQKPPSFSGGQDFPGRASYKGKEKVTSFSTDVENLSSELEFMHKPQPVRSDVTSDIEIEDPTRNSLREFMEVLKDCSPPGAEIADPYGDSIGPLFDIPYFSRVTCSSGFSGPASSLKNFPSPYCAKDLHSRKGKQVLNPNKRRRI
ncbi:uncharacterized protein LOC123226455 [Mangifera indica]|uniref:uncharacterized protein LOC123226455 n=1 Tax=Mangifera indica TaxID=29780 RepID=UPI001CF9FA5F|nr:uncharacterized protein LOC123226455 [Mangifera indica]